MAIRTFNDPRQAYEFLNSWTTTTTTYGIHFHGREVRRVVVDIEEGKPVTASFHYVDSVRKNTGIESIDLRLGLRESQNKSVGML